MGRCGSENFKTLPLLQYMILFQQIFAWMFPVTVLTEVALVIGLLKILIYLFFKTDGNRTLCPGGKFQKLYSWQLLQLLFFPTKRLEMFPATCLKIPIWVLKFHFSNSWKKNIQIFYLTLDPMEGKCCSKLYSSYSYYSFPTKFFLNVPCDSPHKIT